MAKNRDLGLSLPTEDQIEIFGRKLGIVRQEAESIEQYFEKIKEKTEKGTEQEQIKAKILEKQLEFQKELVKQKEKELKNLKEEVKENQGLMGLFKTREEKIKARLNLAQKELEELKKQKNIDEKLIKDKERQIELAEKQLAVEQKIKKVKDGMMSVFGIIKDQLSNIVDLADAVTGGMLKQMLGFFSFEGILENIKQHMKEMREAGEKFAASTGKIFSANWAGIRGHLTAYGISYPKLIQMSGELYANTSKFSDMTPALRGRLTETAARMTNFGISIATAGKNFDSFTKALGMSASQAIATTDKLQRAAIGAGIAPKKMVEEFASAMPRLAVYGARAIEVYTNLQKQAKALGMEMQALTNIVGDQFDTFEGSATAAGKLNAILGGNYLNSVEMLNASEDERVMILKRSMDEAGKNWSTLSKFEQKAIASALGISNMEEANKLFGVSTGEVNQQLKKQEASQGQLTSAQKAAGDGAEKMRLQMLEMNKTMMDLAGTLRETVGEFMKWVKENPGWAQAIGIGIGLLGLFSPLLKKIGEAIGDALLRKMLSAKDVTVSSTTKMAESMEEVSEKAKGVADEATKATSSTGKMADSMSDASKKTKEVAAETSKASTATGKMNAKMSKAGEIANSQAGKIMAFGVAALLMGAGIGIAAYGFSKLVSAFKELNAEQQASALKAMAIAMGGFVIIMLAVAFAGSLTWPVLLAVGAAFLALGIGIGIMMFALSKVVESFTKFTESTGKIFLEIIDKIKEAFLGIFKGIAEVAKNATDDQVRRIKDLAWAIGELGLALAGGAISSGFGRLLGGKTAGESLAIFNASLAQVSTAQLKEFSGVVQNLVSVLSSENLESKLESLATAFKKIKDSINDMPSGKVVSLETLNKTLRIISTIKTDNLSPTNESITLIKDAQPKKEFVDVIENFYKIHFESKQSNENYLLDGIKEIGNLLKENLTSQEGKQIKLVVSGKDLSDAQNNHGDTSIPALLTR